MNSTLSTRPSRPMQDAAHAGAYKLRDEAKLAANQLASLLALHHPTHPLVMNALDALCAINKRLLTQHFQNSRPHAPEKMTWIHGFYKQIEILRAVIKNKLHTAKTHTQKSDVQTAVKDAAKKATSDLDTILRRAHEFYKNLVSEMRSQHSLFDRSPNTLPLHSAAHCKKRLESSTHIALHFISGASYLDEAPSTSTALQTAVSGTCGTCLIILGDIERYRALHGLPPIGAQPKARSGGNKFHAANAWYLQAHLLSPQLGNPHNQLAVIALYNRDYVEALWRYMRAVLSPTPFPLAEDNTSTLCSKTKGSPILENHHTGIQGSI